MSEILDLIFNEIDALAEDGAKLRGVIAGVGRQTDLEVAILKRQNDELREKNKNASDMIDKASNILDKLKKAQG